MWAGIGCGGKWAGFVVIAPLVVIANEVKQSMTSEGVDCHGLRLRKTVLMSLVKT